MPFDGKCQNLQTAFFTFLIFAMVWPVRSIVTDRHIHTDIEMDKPMVVCEILQICLIINNYYADYASGIDMLFPFVLFLFTIYAKTNFRIKFHVYYLKPRSVFYAYLTLWTPSNCLPNSCRRRLHFSHTTPRRQLIFRKTSPGARRFFESEKRRDPSRAFIPLTK